MSISKGSAAGSWLDCRLPPPLVGALCAAVSWGLVQLLPAWTRTARSPWPLVAVLLLLAALFGVGGVWAFRRRQTTINPHAPERASALVTQGPYRFTRNPMYLALVLVLLAWCAWLANPASLLGPLLCVAWLTQWQIKPEERVMREKFAEEYQRYCARVRRWF